MMLKPYDPTNAFGLLREQLNRLSEPGLFPSILQDDDIASGLWSPSVDIREDDKNYVFLVDLPGVDPKDIDVSVEDNSLTIKGERKTETKEEREGYKRIERSRGNFYRRFILPDIADKDNVDAQTKNGVLEIRIPKSEKTKAQKVKIKS